MRWFHLEGREELGGHLLPPPPPPPPPPLGNWLAILTCLYEFDWPLYNAWKMASGHLLFFALLCPSATYIMNLHELITCLKHNKELCTLFTVKGGNDRSTLCKELIVLSNQSQMSISLPVFGLRHVSVHK